MEWDGEGVSGNSLFFSSNGESHTCQAFAYCKHEAEPAFSGRPNQHAMVKGERSVDPGTSFPTSNSRIKGFNWPFFTLQTVAGTIAENKHQKLFSSGSFLIFLIFQKIVLSQVRIICNDFIFS